MKKAQNAAILPLATFVTFDDAIKSILLSAGTRCEYDFDLVKMENICKKSGLPLGSSKISSLILAYCKKLKKENGRVIDMKFENLGGTLRATFTIRLFGIDDLSVLESKHLKTVVSSGEWRSGTGHRVKK